jgi:prolyl oligopeptidase
LLFAAAACLVGAAPEPADPYLPLEEVQGARALDRVKQWNAATMATLTAQPHFQERRDRARALLDDEAQIAEPQAILGNRVLNLWRDRAHPRGLWRIAGLAGFTAGKPDWRVLINVDALGKAEGKSWVWHGADCLGPVYRRCLVSLSPGGGDADTKREFDLETGKFVDDGFVVPVGKTRVTWAGPDALYIATNWGPVSLTPSGYPRILKLWKRGTPLASATPLAEAQPTDIGIAIRRYQDGATRWPIMAREIDFYHDRNSHIAPDGRLVPVPLPDDAEIEDVLDGRVIAQLQSAWHGFAAGSLIAYRIADVLAGRTPTIERVFVPSASQSIEEVGAGGGVVWVKLLDDVSGKLLSLARTADGDWRSRAVPLPDKLTIHLGRTADDSPLAFATVEGFLTPPTLYAVTPAAPPRPVQALPARFDASTMAVTQRFATSKDGTRVPYFLVRRKGGSGPVPALIHAYGGFRDAQTPTYLVNQPYRAGPAALFWIEEGNAFVLANIRGGSEYGPRWHDEGLREHRQRVFDDLHAVAEDLVKTGVSAKKRIAVSGRSNGGLLVGVAMTQRPDLYGAVVMGSPLTDMKRYSHLLAGASWMGEYGDPDVPGDWAFISAYSPYQQLKPGVAYPAPFIYTSTLDDRVHPGHARKFAAKLEGLGDAFFYHEATEGGHSIGADRSEDALRAALIASYLDRQLPR